MLTQFIGRFVRTKFRAFSNTKQRLSKHSQKATNKRETSQSYRRTMRFSGLALSLSMIVVLYPDFSGVAHASHVESVKPGWLVSTSILSKVPSDKVTVGIIPYYLKDNQVYILLGRERIDGGKEKSGKFSDFGGSVELNGTNLAHNAIRELKEETMGQIALNERDLYESGRILYKASSKNRDIIYIFYPMSEQEYKKTRRLNSLWPALCSHKKDSVDCEKDQFTWFNVQNITNKKNQVRDIDGNSNLVYFRDFFVQDCLEHPDFPKMVEHISYTAAPSLGQRLRARSKL